jgi:ABC-type multidrug transport system ATPase subunit
MTVTIEATGLRKRYGSVAALDGLDLLVEEGHVVGLLGPNGAGKTTALRILVGLVRADAGSVTIAGEPITRRWIAGERVGAMVATPVLYPHLSGGEYLRVLATSWGWSESRTKGRITAALGLVDLDTVGGRPAKGYSTGMRQRLGIALALLADPPILILDEPVNDPPGDRRHRLVPATRHQRVGGPMATVATILVVAVVVIHVYIVVLALPAALALLGVLSAGPNA